MTPEVELVTTGAELLNGSVVNRHAQWLGDELGRLGWRLVRDTTVADDRDAIRDALFSALARTGVVVVTGGLGPTSDDVTREVAAEWAGTGLVMHEPSRQVVIDLYRRRQKPLNDTVERHALVVEGAQVLDNRHGLAPGEYLCRNDRHLFLLPGPPREFQGVMRDHVLPWMMARNAGGQGKKLVFQVSGMGESDIAARLTQMGMDALRIDVAYCALPARVTIRVAELPGSPDDVIRAESMIREALGSSLYSDREEAIEQTVVRQLGARALTLAVAESCTGGMVGQRITALPGSSAVFRGGVIAYANDVKTGLLGVRAETLARCGAVSEEVAGQMAEGARRVAASDYAIAVTGIAGPDGGTAEKPVGLVYIALADSQTTISRELRLGGGRETIREAAASLSLDLLRLRLSGLA